MASSYLELAALEAWKKPKGEHEIDLTPLGHARKYIVIRHSKFVLVFNNDGQVVAFPKPEHIPTFKEAAKGLEPNGPADSYPGSVGSINVVKNPEATYITNVQSHYKQGSKHPIPNNLASKYSGWRRAALDEIIRSAKENSAVVRISKKVVQPRGIGAPIRFNDVLVSEFKDIAKKHGVELENDWPSTHYRYKLDFSEKR